jgi:hypothetical protein
VGHSVYDAGKLDIQVASSLRVCLGFESECPRRTKVSELMLNPRHSLENLRKDLVVFSTSRQRQGTHACLLRFIRIPSLINVVE